MNETPIKISVLAVSTRICLSYHISDNCESLVGFFIQMLAEIMNFLFTFYILMHLFLELQLWKLQIMKAVTVPITAMFLNFM
jgi:hypothetical protein